MRKRNRKKKQNVMQIIPWLVMLATLLLMCIMDHEFTFSQESEPEVSGPAMDRWEYYFTPYYEQETPEDADDSVWTMQPSGA
jgi:hypothetical protein